MIPARSAHDLTVRLRMPLILKPPPVRPRPASGALARPRPSRTTATTVSIKTMPSLDAPMPIGAWLLALPWRFFFLAFAISVICSYALERWCAQRRAQAIRPPSVTMIAAAHEAPARSHTNERER